MSARRSRGGALGNPGPTEGIKPREPAPRPIDAGVDIGHVHLKAADLARMRTFYVDILGFDVVFHQPTRNRTESSSAGTARRRTRWPGTRTVT